MKRVIRGLNKRAGFLLTAMVGVVGSAGAAPEPFAQRQVAIQGLVVSETSAGLVGTAVDIIATVRPGEGEETRFEREVGQDMTTSLAEAVRAVQVDHPEWDGTQVRMSFENKYADKDGGSAGAAYAVALRSLLEG